jgi:hypothetical protein
LVGDYGSITSVFGFGIRWRLAGDPADLHRRRLTIAFARNKCLLSIGVFHINPNKEGHTARSKRRNLSNSN